jgi:hypothetical protein
MAYERRIGRMTALASARGDPADRNDAGESVNRGQTGIAHDCRSSQFAPIVTRRLDLLGTAALAGTGKLLCDSPEQGPAVGLDRQDIVAAALTLSRVLRSFLYEVEPNDPATLLAVAVTCGLWWVYFGHVRSTFEHALAHCEGNVRSQMARDTFSVLHFPLLCGVIAMAAATEAALAHPDVPLALDVRAALGAGAVLYLCGTAAAIWRATGRLLVWRWVLAPTCAAIVIAVGGPPWLSMSVVLVMLVAVAAVEPRGA